jgi:uncharacterized protein (TIGR01777 family)
MKIAISGGTGFIGSTLAVALASQGHDITILTRRRKGETLKDTHILFLECDPTVKGVWQEKIAGHQVIVNLAGTSIFRRWNKKNRMEITNSRILTTKNLVESIAKEQMQQILLLSVSGVGYYGYHGDEFLNEDSPPGKGFLAEMAKQWEFEASKAHNFGARVVICRLGQVFGTDGGALPGLVTISKFGIGSAWGNGTQWTSWIHKNDVIKAFLFLIKNTTINGPVNISSPNPVRNKDMMRLIRQHMHKKAIVPSIPASILKLAAGEFSSSFLNGQRVIPQKLIDAGYSFLYPDLDKALSELLSDTNCRV